MRWLKSDAESLNQAMTSHVKPFNMVIGYPLHHTQSPLLHNTLYAMLGCDAVMLTRPTQKLSPLIQKIKKLSIGLVAVTMPFKQKILTYLDEVSTEGEALNAVNTVICRQGKLFGYNTDVFGVEYALRDQIVSDKNVLIIGAGGAACAAAYYLKKKKAKLFWLNRTCSRALSMAKIWGGNTVQDNDIYRLSIDIIVNATPLGMFPDTSRSPLPNYSFEKNQIIFDMVYNPFATALMKRARSQGATCLSGLDMFIGQGLRQIELWLNKSIPTSEIIEPVESKLKLDQCLAKNK